MKDILVKTFKSNIEAEMASVFLKKAGIKNVIQKKGATDSIITVGDASIFVLEKDAKKAKQLLENWVE